MLANDSKVTSRYYHLIDTNVSVLLAIFFQVTLPLEHSTHLDNYVVARGKTAHQITGEVLIRFIRKGDLVLGQLHDFLEAGECNV